MALIKPKELRTMRPEDVKARFKELSDELMHERGIAAMGGAPASPGKLRALRKNIARIHTVMREQELAARKKMAESKAPSKEEKPKEKQEPKAAPKPKEKKEKTTKKAAEEESAAKSEEEKK